MMSAKCRYHRKELGASLVNIAATSGIPSVEMLDLFLKHVPEDFSREDDLMNRALRRSQFDKALRLLEARVPFQ